MIVESYSSALREVSEILAEAGLSDGEKPLGEEEAHEAIRPFFWYEQIESKEAAKKPINVIYNILTVSHRGMADGRPSHPNVRIGVDAIVLRKSIGDPLVVNTIKAIEKAFLAHGYQFEAEVNMSSPLDAERSILSFTASKTI